MSTFSMSSFLPGLNDVMIRDNKAIGRDEESRTVGVHANLGTDPSQLDLNFVSSVG